MEKPVEAILAISPGNSHFTEANLQTLVRDTTPRYTHVSAFIPDIPAIATYEALGYKPNRAREKAVSKGNNLKGKLRRAMDNLKLGKDNVRILDWSEDIEPDERYKAARARMDNLYDTCAAFREAANDATRHVLEGANRPIPDMPTATQQGVKYLLAELSFLEAASEILSVGKSNVVYHRPWPVYERLIAGEFDGRPRPQLGFELFQKTANTP